MAEEAAGFEQRRSSMEENIAPGDEAFDPYDTPSKPGNKRAANRYSAINTSLLSDYQSTASPSQAKKALEAHMLETDRRLEEASKLGTALVQQRNELAERMKEVEKAQSDRELGPELRQKLVDVEKEYHELGRDSARAFLAPRRGHASEDLSQDENVTMFRSASPTKFNARATDSPSKMTAPSRKQRNQAGSRVHDIEFATEISTSLLAQVRQLQAALAERDDSLKAAQSERDRLLLDMQTHSLRLRSLDESEQQYKDENWGLETQMQELLSAQRHAAEREERLQHNLAVANAEKTSAQRELDEIRQSHGKLAEETAGFRKTHETEMGALRRSMIVAENDRNNLQRKLEELVSHNTELANVISLNPNSTEPGLEGARLSDPDDLSLEKSDIEHQSPPGSPVKGARNSMLESETLKNSLTHAHRMIQSLKGNVQKEKSEKFDLRRQLQQARDELDIQRQGPAGKKGKVRDLKHQSSRPGQLGNNRSANTEVIEGGEWEDSEADGTPGKVATTTSKNDSSAAEATDAYATANETDAFDTANETETDAGFETATERDAPTDSEFITGNEGADSGGDVTETEDSTNVGRSGTIRGRPTPVRPSHKSRSSFHSTASTSDEDDTPARSSKYGSMMFRSKPGGSRWSVMGGNSAQSSIKGSPASFAPAGHSLGDELGDLMDEESVDGESVGDANTPSRIRGVSRQLSRNGTPHRTPSSRGLGLLGDGIVLHPTPQVPPMPKIPMVDSSIMTEPWEPTPVIKEVPVEVVKTEVKTEIKEVPVPYEVVKTVEVPVEVIREVQLPPPPKPPMSDGAVMTEPWEPTPVVKEVPVPYEVVKTEIKEVPVEVIKTVEVPVETIREVQIPPPPKAPGVDNAIMTDPWVPEPQIKEVSVPHEVEKIVYVDQPRDVEKIVHVDRPVEIVKEVPVDREVEKIVYVDRPVETVKEVPVDREVEKIVYRDSPPVEVVKEVPVERIVEVEKIVYRDSPPVEIIKEIPVDREVEKIVHVDRPVETIKEVPVDREVERIVYVDRPVETIKEIPVDREVEKIVYVEKPVEIIKEVPVDRIVEVERIVDREVPVPYETIKEVEVIREVKVPATPTKTDTTDMGTVMTPAKQSKFADTATSPRDVDFAAGSLPTPEDTPANSIANLRSLDQQPIDVRRPETSLFAPGPRLDTRKFEVSSVRSLDVEPRDVPTQVPRQSEQTQVQSIADIPPQDLERPATASKDKSFSFAPIYTPSNPPPESAQESSRPTTAVKEDDKHTLEKAAGAGIIGGTLGWIGGKVSNALTGQGEQPDASSKAVEAGNTAQPLGEVSVNKAGKVPEPITPSQTARSGVDDVFAPTPARPARATTVSSGPPSPKPNLPSKSVRRPGSVSSMRRSDEVPPLPADHQKVIEAASKRNTAELPKSVTMGAMGPPIASASAMRANQLRSATPVDQQMPIVMRGDIPRSSRQMRSAKSLNSRRSSISSFESEIDRRFQAGQAMGQYAPGLEGTTDPRMIQAITQTMIGEYLWKYTRKAGGAKMSANRHRRFFWVHPYTRTLYWSEQDPATAGRAQLKAKSVQIEAVRVVQDDNPFPPGLHRKSLIVLTPSGGRDLKFTAPTGMRHETWFNSLSYLLLRQNPDAAQESVATHQDFNPSQALMGRDMRGESDRVSLSTYNSRPGTQRASRASSVNRMGSPIRGGASSIVTGSPATVRRHTPGIGDTASPRPVSRGQDFNPRGRTTSGRQSMSLSGRISSVLRPGRTSISGGVPEEAGEGKIYNASVVQSESAEDLRQHYEQSIEEENGHVENVRACCDGQHDVGSISRRAGSRVSNQHHHHH